MVARSVFLAMPELAALPLSALLLPRFEQGRVEASTNNDAVVADDSGSGEGRLDFRGFCGALAFLSPKLPMPRKVDGTLCPQAPPLQLANRHTLTQTLARRAALFEALDGAGTGFVDAPALARFYSVLLGSGGRHAAPPSAAHAAVAAAALAHADADADGRLSRAEFVALVDTPELAGKLTVALF